VASCENDVKATETNKIEKKIDFMTDNFC
jgi:hypothetical protein